MTSQTDEDRAWEAIEDAWITAFQRDKVKPLGSLLNAGSYRAGFLAGRASAEAEVERLTCAFNGLIQKLDGLSEDAKDKGVETLRTADSLVVRGIGQELCAAAQAYAHAFDLARRALNPEKTNAARQPDDAANADIKGDGWGVP